MAIHHTIKWLTLGLMAIALSGCLGGSIAQQLANSLLLKGADKATTMMLDTQERNNKTAAQKMPLKDTAPDHYTIAFLNSGFENVAIQVEPLPAAPLEDEKPIQMMQATKLVRVEVLSLLLDDEKQRILEKASIQGATDIPPKSEWQQWQIAIGAAESNQASNSQQAITFLIPPEIGKMHSGAKALVELSSVGELSIARYTVN